LWGGGGGGGIISALLCPRGLLTLSTGVVDINFQKWNGSHLCGILFGEHQKNISSYPHNIAHKKAQNLIKL